ncbi:hypothetical protein ACFQZ4_11910 [Catellatospora coxensis]|uniref:Transcriptional regulator n=2 Tax=Catellatospora coxensis TaxID=310354 RepID=A0A8J3LDU1_9ACTN|nr:hypothetical protein Cco03nite_75750 [Catellatospora coxensis]
MTDGRPHPAACALSLRAQMIYASGVTEPVPVEMLTDIAAQIIEHCGHQPLKAFRLAHNWTVAHAVSEVHALCEREGLGRRGLHERSWKEWEAGGNTGHDYRDLLCRLFQTGPVQLGFAHDYTPRASSAPHPTYVDKVVSSSEPWSDMHRRTFFKAPALAAFASSPDLDSVFRSISPARRSGAVDPARVHDLALVSSAYRRSYQDMPAGELLDAALAHLRLTYALDPRFQPEPTRTALLTVIGEMAALIGALYLLDRGDQANGWRYVDLAWEAAKAADSAELQTIILGGRSFGVAHYAGDHRTGLELAAYACEVADGGASNETRGWAAAVASERAASIGDLSECHRRLSASRAALAGAPSETVPLGIGIFNADKLNAYEGGDMVRLGRYRDAEPVLDAAISRLDPALQRHRCTALIDRAEARLGADEVDGACSDGQAALELVAQVQHSGNLKRLRALATRARDTGSQAGRDLWRNVITATADTKGALS